MLFAWPRNPRNSFNWCLGVCNIIRRNMPQRLTIRSETDIKPAELCARNSNASTSKTELGTIFAKKELCRIGHVWAQTNLLLCFVKQTQICARQTRTTNLFPDVKMWNKKRVKVNRNCGLNYLGRFEMINYVTLPPTFRYHITINYSLSYVQYTQAVKCDL
jgi:hypothetical protein